MKFIPLLNIIVLLIVLLSCRNSSPKKIRHSDPFYNDTGEGKFLVVPLIKPYRVVTDEGAGIGWQMDLSGRNITQPFISGIEKIAVVQEIIMVFAPTNPSMDSSRPDMYPIWHWVVIIPEQQLEEGFDTEEAFLDYIRTYGIENPNWVNPMDAFKQFESTGCLDWIPDCP